MKIKAAKKTSSVPEKRKPFFGSSSNFFSKAKDIQPKFFEPTRKGKMNLNPVTGLSPSSFVFYSETSNWKTAIVTGLFLSYSRYIFETGRVNFKIQIGVPIKLADGDFISDSYAKTSCSSAANLAVTTLGSLHHNEYGKPGWKTTMPRKLAYYMQLYLTAMIPGTRVSTTITSSVKQHPAVWL